MHSLDYVGMHKGEESPTASAISLKSLFLLGITGAIVPCPEALVVLLGALAIPASRSECF